MQITVIQLRFVDGFDEPAMLYKSYPGKEHWVSTSNSIIETDAEGTPIPNGRKAKFKTIDYKTPWTPDTDVIEIL